jgi:hypothetical protein
MTYEDTEAELKLKVCPEDARKAKALRVAWCGIWNAADMCSDTPNGEFSGNESIKAWLSCRMCGKRTSLNHKEPTDDASGLLSTVGTRFSRT